VLDLIPEFPALDIQSVMPNISALLQEKLVYASTCLGVHNPLIIGGGANFDVLIVDEAGQVAESALWQPILLSKSVFMVGDWKQLPPLWRSMGDRSTAGQASGVPCSTGRFVDPRIGLSLFERLCRIHPESVVELVTQFRMGDQIMHVANALFYDGKLRQGQDTKASARCAIEIIKLSHSSLERHVILDLVKREVASNGGQRSAVGLLTPYRSKVEDFTQAISAALALTDVGNSVEGDTNHEAATAVTSVNEQWRVATLPEALRERLLQLIAAQVPWVTRPDKRAARPSVEDVWVSTIDKAQGREWDVVIFSALKKDETTSEEWLKDKRRLNVAVTRAKKKLVLIVQGDEMDAELVNVAVKYGASVSKI
jgi:DNA replication ATP-dependent helicase Dna2